MSKESPASSVPVFSIDGLRDEMGAVNCPTKEFLLSCLSEGVFEIVPPRTGKNWERNVEMTWRYFLTEETRTHLAEEYRMSSQAVDTMLQRTLEQLWKNAPKKIQRTFDRESLKVTKKLRLARALEYKAGRPIAAKDKTTIGRYQYLLYTYEWEKRKRS